jgi:hypothetical protein
VVKPFLLIGLSGRSLRRAVSYLLLGVITVVVAGVVAGIGVGITVAAVITGTVWAVVRVMNAGD